MINLIPHIYTMKIKLLLFIYICVFIYRVILASDFLNFQ